MTPEASQAVHRAAAEIELQVDLLDREGVKYARLCTETVLSPRWRGNMPQKPPGMQTKAAEMIRELVLDELAQAR